MNTMSSDKLIYRILNALSILALAYYGATSIHYLFESDVNVKLSRYEAVTSTLLIGEREAEKGEK
ncbi:hypothetical protein [Kamptonema sp. UHCC 0994]|uniref:hypothetical protein n=1 Tax=Kamptonema sp. UHCC 0994 TaxID=3031329 RepID=UPI0023B8A7A1|nr:hypothetical protein [Kamptonema sp. UHCC 0994]MDF0554108.1 hypothetical protein [Kamptonema sp. UHCC 0994]